MIRKYSIDSQDYIGVFSVTSEGLTIIPFVDEMPFIDAMETPVVKTTIGGTRLIGALSVMNSNGMLVANIMDEREIEPILDHTDVTVVPEKHNALGNNILLNDKAALIHPKLSPVTEDAIRKNLDVEVERGTIAEMKMVGSVAVATNRGILCHPHVKDKEITMLEELFDVEVSKTTANHGSGWIGTCLIANSKGAVIGSSTTPIEMGRIEEGLGYLD